LGIKKIKWNVGENPTFLRVFVVFGGVSLMVFSGKLETFLGLEILLLLELDIYIFYWNSSAFGWWDLSCRLFSTELRISRESAFLFRMSAESVYDLDVIEARKEECDHFFMRFCVFDFAVFKPFLRARLKEIFENWSIVRMKNQQSKRIMVEILRTNVSFEFPLDVIDFFRSITDTIEDLFDLIF